MESPRAHETGGGLTGERLTQGANVEGREKREGGKKARLTARSARNVSRESAFLESASSVSSSRSREEPGGRAAGPAWATSRVREAWGDRTSVVEEGGPGAGDNFAGPAMAIGGEEPGPFPVPSLLRKGGAVATKAPSGNGSGTPCAGKAFAEKGREVWVWLVPRGNIQRARELLLL